MPLFFGIVGLLTTVFFVLLLMVRARSALYALSLHDALPISAQEPRTRHGFWGAFGLGYGSNSLSCSRVRRDRKSTRLNSSHLGISYAVFCLNKKTRRRSR